MEPRSEEKKSRFQIEKLEERIAPSRFGPGFLGTGQEHGESHSSGHGNADHGHAHAGGDVHGGGKPGDPVDNHGP